jgi:trehalose 6-phosphate phosphatase
VLEPLARDLSRAALVVDFDGTLAPIVDHPDDARPLPRLVDVLRDLTGSLALVGVVSGRPVEFLRARLPVDGLALVGQYGLERLAGTEIRRDPRAEPYVAGVAAAASEAASRWPRLVIERKGDVAVALHWRTVPDDAPDADAVRALADAHDLALLPGRMVIELRPPLPVDKGAAVETLLVESGASAAAFAGDDHGDLTAFDALDRLQSQQLLDAAIRIAIRSEEAPVELLERADLVVDGPGGLAALLEPLRASIGRRRKRRLLRGRPSTPPGPG